MKSSRSTSTRLIEVVFAELDDEALDRLAELLAPRLEGRMISSATQPDSWLDTKEAAEHLGITRNALHKATAGRSIPFEQDRPGCKCWFKRSELDAWRRGQNLNAAKTQPRRTNSTGTPLAADRKTAF